MNNDRRQALAEIAEQIADLFHKVTDYAAEEQESFDNLPEGLQQSERGQAIETAAEQLSEAANALDDAQRAIEEATTGS